MQHKIYDHEISSFAYGVSEILANCMIVLLSLWIYWKYIRRRIGTFKPVHCTKFDFYAIVSLLWLLTVTLLFVVYSHWGYFFANLVRGIAIILPGIVHKYYIRFQLDVTPYLGDMTMYKLVVILFYFIQILSNTVTISMNEEWFTETNAEIFSIEDGDTDNYHLTWILAGLLGVYFCYIRLYNLTQNPRIHRSAVFVHSAVPCIDIVFELDTSRGQIIRLSQHGLAAFVDE